ncbi:MAG: RNA polymerase sigma factor SigJ [Hyphomicrobiaceae bacterium]|nr:RNA polymerase sigma factor SigJ [Hyphomicrobiaceae bacterium]
MSKSGKGTANVFEKARRRLWGLAYRMLGSAADADDAVQETWLRWQSAMHDEIASPDAWLTSVCSRLCIDMLRAAHRTRVDYVGPWLPEPLFGDVAIDPLDTVELASSLSMAFLLLLERLTPVERAAYLLHDVFDYGYDDIAAVLEKTPDACRQLVSRARRHLKDGKSRFPDNKGEQDRLLTEFLAALRSGETDQLASLLAEEAELWTDGGGKVIAQTEIVHGRDEIVRILAMIWDAAWRELDFEEVEINGRPGLVLQEGGGIAGALTLSETPDKQIAGVYVVRNPDKLEHIRGNG